MPTLWPAGPWRFEAAVTITECNEQSVTNWLQFAQIADSGAGTKTTAVARSGAPVNQFCAAVQRVAVIAPRTGHKVGRGIWDIPERTRPLTCNVPVGGSAYGQPSARWRAELPRGVSALSAARWDGSPLCESGRAATAS